MRTACLCAENQTGYCDYYASAMVVMLRSLAFRLAWP